MLIYPSPRNSGHICAIFNINQINQGFIYSKYTVLRSCEGASAQGCEGFQFKSLQREICFLPDIGKCSWKRAEFTVSNCEEQYLNIFYFFPLSNIILVNGTGFNNYYKNYKEQQKRMSINKIQNKKVRRDKISLHKLKTYPLWTLFKGPSPPFISSCYPVHWLTYELFCISETPVGIECFYAGSHLGWLSYTPFCSFISSLP